MCIRDSLNNPVEILGDADKHVVGLKCVKMRLGEPDASGRRGVTPKMCIRDRTLYPSSPGPWPRAYPCSTAARARR